MNYYKPFLALALLSASLSLLSAQTRFRVEKNGDKWWLEAPGGSKFLSLGVCCVDTGISFADYDPSNQSYSASRFYPDAGAWASDVVKQLTSWNFNTIGAWSDERRLSLVPGTSLYETPILNLGATAGAPWKDLWSKETEKTFNDTAASQIKNFHRQNVIGYFSDNELGWWEGALFDWIWKSDPASGQRTHFLRVLRAQYPTWSAVQRDFTPSGASDFDDLLNHGRLFLRAGGSGMKTVQIYIGVLADRYYSLSKQTIKRLDPGALYLGDRYISNFYPEVARSAGKYVDVLSTNLNGDWNDGSFAHFYLPTLEAACERPILISEYYQSAVENSSGNKNNSSGFPVVQTQDERESRAEVSTKYLLSQSYIVGTHWFQYYDEPTNGRGDGENYNFGLVDVTNKPYPLLTGMFSTLDPNTLHSNGAAVAADAAGGLPQASDHPEKLETWSRNRGYVPPKIDSGRADLYACYAPDGLYVAVYWNEDRFSEAYYSTLR